MGEKSPNRQTTARQPTISEHGVGPGEGSLHGSFKPIACFSGQLHMERPWKSQREQVHQKPGNLQVDRRNVHEIDNTSRIIATPNNAMNHT